MKIIYRINNIKSSLNQLKRLNKDIQDYDLIRIEKYFDKIDSILNENIESKLNEKRLEK